MKHLKTLLGAAGLLLLTGGVAMASDAGHGPNYWDFGFRVLNFILFVAIIWKFAGKAIGGFFTGRTSQIKNDLEDLDARRRAAEGKLAEVEKSIVNIEQEREAILDEFVKQGEALKAAIVEDAAKKATRMSEQAEVSIATERAVALEKLKSEMADLIVQAAEKVLREKVSKEDHAKLVDDYLTKVVLN